MKAWVEAGAVKGAYLLCVSVNSCRWVCDFGLKCWECPGTHLLEHSRGDPLCSPGHSLYHVFGAQPCYWWSTKFSLTHGTVLNFREPI